MIPRYGISVGIGAAITFGLLFVMQLLIANDRGVVIKERSVRFVDLVRVERPPEIVTKRDMPEKPPEPRQQPEMPKTTSAGANHGGIAVSMTAPRFEMAVSTGFGGFVADGEYLPIVKVTPVYPYRAQERGIEGYAIVEYTVTELGTTTDIRLVETSHSVFERSCVEAAAKFKYRPRVVNGEAIAVPGVRNRCTYELQNAR